MSRNENERMGTERMKQAESSLLSKILEIRYVKLHFFLEFIEDTKLPVNKPSALRGGIGEMLLNANCIKDRKCETCDFESECIVQRTMYSKFEQKPEFVTTGDSVGYIIECENYEENFSKGDILQFQLILFGKTIVYFNQYLQAVFALGQVGIGKKHARFTICQVTNTKGIPILDGNNVYMRYYQVTTLGNYVKYRLERWKDTGDYCEIVFHTPLTQKFKGEFLRKFDMEAIIKAVKRRLYILACFENIESQKWYEETIGIPTMIAQNSRNVQVARYSSRQDSKMLLKGIEGSIQIEGISDEILQILLAGEITHIGKNTSFGFGRYSVVN